MPRLTDRAWPPYVAGVVIGLLQIPAFLLLDTALGTSSSYVTVGASVAEFVDPAVRQIEYAAKHLDGAVRAGGARGFGASAERARHFRRTHRFAAAKAYRQQRCGSGGSEPTGKGGRWVHKRSLAKAGTRNYGWVRSKVLTLMSG